MTKEKNETTKCPSCHVESDECRCGLTAIVVLHKKGIMAGNVEVATIEVEDPNKPECKIQAHSVILHLDRIVEQYMFGNLVTTIGPFVGPQGEEVFDYIVEALKKRAIHGLSKKPTDDV